MSTYERIAEIGKIAIRDQVFPGHALAFKIGDDPTIHTICSGNQMFGFPKDNLSISTATMFDLASLTKAVGAFDAHKLVEEKRIDLSTPISQYLPFRHHSAEEVTVRDCFGYLVHFKLFGDIENPANYLECAKRNLSHEWWLEMFYHHAECVKLEKPQSSNLAPMVMGLIIEKTTGKDLRDSIRESVLDPLDARSVIWGNELTPESKRFVAPTSLSGKRGVPHDPLTCLMLPKNIAVSGLFGNIRDTLKLAEPLAGSTKLFSKGSYNRMISENVERGESFGYGSGVYRLKKLYIPRYPKFSENAALMIGTTGSLIIGCEETSENPQIAIAHLSNASISIRANELIGDCHPIYYVRQDSVEAIIDFATGK